MRNSLLVSVFGILLSLVGCASQPKVSQVPPEVEELLHSVHLGRAQLTSLKAEGRVEFRRPGRAVRFHAWFLAEFPSKFFVEAGGFGFPVSQANAIENHIRLYIPAKALHYEGEGETGMASLLGIRISTQEWVSLLLGYIPEPKGNITKMHVRRGVKTITMKDGKNVQVWKINRSGWLESIREKGDRNLVIRYGRPMSTPVGSYPSRLSLSTSEGALSVKFRKVFPNEPIPSSHFSIDVPPGIASRAIERAEILIGK